MPASSVAPLTSVRLTERLHFEYPIVGKAVEDIAKSYDREADWWDSEAENDKQLHH